MKNPSDELIEAVLASSLGNLSDDHLEDAVCVYNDEMVPRDHEDAAQVDEPCGPAEGPAGNWQYDFKDDKGAIIAQLAISGAYMGEGEADAAGKMVGALLKTVAQTRPVSTAPSRLILPDGPTGPMRIARSYP